MQLVEGQPLDKLIPESGLPVERTLEIAIVDHAADPDGTAPLGLAAGGGPSQVR